MKKRLVIGLTILILFSTYKPQKLFLKNKLNIQELKVENNYILKEEEIKKDLIFVYNTNLIFLNTSDIKKILKKKSFVESFQVKKIYPNTLKIIIFEKKPIAILQNKSRKFYISENIDLINYIDLDQYKNLPTIFGDIENFKILYKDLKKINFPLSLIKSYYLFESKRWDIKTYNQKVIKLPPKNYVKSLENYMNLKKENIFNIYKVFDYRMNNQLILK